MPRSQKMPRVRRFPTRTIWVSKPCVVLVSTIYHPDEQCGVRLRRESPQVGAKGEAGCCQQQSVICEIGRGGVLWRASGEGNEEVLEPRNLGYGVISSYRKSPIPFESIGSSRRGCKNQIGGMRRWQGRVFELGLAGVILVWREVG